MPLRAVLFVVEFGGKLKNPLNRAALPRWASLILLLCFLCPISGCSTSSGGASQGALAYPDGLLVDPASLAAMHGIYAGDNWMSTDVRFRMHAEQAARTVRLVVYVPEFAPWTSSPGEIESLDPAGKTLATRALKPGRQTVDLPIPKGAISSDGIATVRLHLTGGRVPKDLGLNGDIRKIAAMLVSASAN